MATGSQLPLPLPGAESTGPAPSRLGAPGLALRHWPRWAADADGLLERLGREIPWRQEAITLFGRTHPLPRLTAWVGDPGCSYTYSGLRNEPHPWPPLLAELRGRVEAAAGGAFNALLLNSYRDGRDRMHWHADDEPELDPRAPIATLSLGVPRTFRLKPRRPGAAAVPLNLELGHGDLLVMDPPTQEHWLHALPPRRRVAGERINLTFRRMRPQGGPSI